jgi:ornithine decarboxylase
LTKLCSADSFHVGSGCYDANAFADAVYRARRAFDQAAQLGFNFHLLDVGGGFTHVRYGDGITFEKIAAVLNAAIEEHFPSHIRVIAEPGRYFAASAFTIATNIIARRTVLRDHIEKQDLDGDTIMNDAALTGNDHPAFMCKCALVSSSRALFLDITFRLANYRRLHE